MLAAHLATGLLDGPLFDVARRPLLERHVAPTPVVWAGSARSQLAVEFWSFLLEQQEARQQSTVFATPRLSERQARTLCESASCATASRSPLADAPVAGIRCEPSGSAVRPPRPPTAPRSRVRSETALGERGAGARPAPPVPVHRERPLAAVKLEAFGVPAAGAYGATAASSLPELLLEFWSITDQMLAAGQARTSSIRSPRRRGTTTLRRGATRCSPRSRRACSPPDWAAPSASCASTRSTRSRARNSWRAGRLGTCARPRSCGAGSTRTRTRWP